MELSKRWFATDAKGVERGDSGGKELEGRKDLPLPDAVLSCRKHAPSAASHSLMIEVWLDRW